VDSEKNEQRRLEKLRFHLESILDNAVEDKRGHELFDELFNFFEKILDDLSAGKVDFVIFMTRKAWCLYQVFLPFFSSEKYSEIKDRITHDSMLAPYFNKCEKPWSNVMVAVVDDSCIKGDTISKCVRRLRHCYNVKPENIYLHAYSILDNAQNKSLYIDAQNEDAKKHWGVPGEDSWFRIRKRKKIDPESKNIEDFFIIRWGEDRAFDKILVNNKHIRALSRVFVGAIHMSSVAYVAFTANFSMELSDAEKLLGDMKRPQNDYLRQEHLKSDFSNGKLSWRKKFEFYNITSPIMYENGVEAFVLFPTTKNKKLSHISWLYSGEESISCLRFYINNKTKKVRIIPYVSLPALKTDTDITDIFPSMSSLSELFKEDVILKNQIKEGERIHEGKLAAYRLLCYSASYLFGKAFIKKYCGDMSKRIKCDHAATLGLHSPEFYDWLKKDAYSDLKQNWGKLAAKGTHPKFVNDEREALGKLFDKLLDECFGRFKPERDDYYHTLSAFLRRLAKESEALSEENEKQPNKALVFKGVPVNHLLLELLELAHDETKRNEIISAIFMVCDAGEGSIYVYQRDETIGTYVTDGEQTIHDIYNRQPSYACFLQRLKEFDPSNLEPGKLDKIIKDVREYFERQIKGGRNLGLPIDVLMNPLAEIKNNPNRQSDDRFCVYINRRTDSSADFFEELQWNLDN
jgi:hypothetical protein